jgi:uncharacterized repeat protein (TIGR03803 family)
VYSFPCGAGGGLPVAPLVQASDGNFYGTTSQGGKYGLGVVFKWDQQGNVTLLHHFSGGTSDGDTPYGGLMQATDGILYGTTGGGGASSNGTVFKVTTGGVYNLEYSFSSIVGTLPEATILQHTNGKLYGTTNIGGAANFGSVYSVDLGAASFITFVLPSGKVGQTAQILGQGLTGTSNVTFNGLPATSFLVLSDTYMTAIVPAGATTGTVVVTTPSGSLSSNVNFRISK